MKKILPILLLSLVVSINAYAGRPCNEVNQTSNVIQQASSSAINVEKALNNSHAEVVLIARVGQDLSKYNLKYSHVGLAYKVGNDWSILHELNTCGSAESSLYVQGLANFFLDDMFSYESRIFIPSKELQETIKTKIISNVKNAEKFHTTKYNMLAYPFSTKYQNSNQFILELLASTMSKEVNIENREQAQQWLKLAGYQPTTLNVGTGTRLGARIFKANIAFDDHPFDRRMAGMIDTITVDSIYTFVTKKDPKGYFIEVL
jgi:hypothetical protein